ncbi:DBF4B protein, partial [Chaetops frenatus]|nr:DBF4B protein [Chaetops frenatus]
PLHGQSFYLDLPSGRGARDLAEAIERLGGVTESFLSKEVTCVVSSNREAKWGQARIREEQQSSPTAESTKSTSLVPATPKGNPARSRQKPPYTALLSRGKELLHKAMKNQVSSLGQALLGLGDTCSGSSILANARLWGVQILHVDGILHCGPVWIIPWALLGLWGCQTLGSALCAAELLPVSPSCIASAASSSAREQTGELSLKPPFLKVEDQSRQFRPLHHQFQSFPDLNFLAPKSSSPFEPLKSLSSSCQASTRGKSPRSTPITVPRKRRGFCECCQETFEELQKHLQSPQHQRFAQDDSHYIPVDCVISQLTNSF